MTMFRALSDLMKSEIAQPAYGHDKQEWILDEGFRDDAHFDSIVQAILEKMRTPTPAIIEAMRRQIGPLGIMWTAAIDAILSEDE